MAAETKHYTRTVIERNSVKCLDCHEEIESRNRHDFVTCNCGAISVDGGRDYLKRSGRLGNYVDTSLSHEEPREKYEWEK